MKKDELVINEIYKELFKDNLNQYCEQLSRKESVIDSKGTFSQVNKIFIHLSETEKQALINMMKIIMTDTASTIFGTLDGTHFVNNIEEDFQLIYGDEEIQGDLQDHFLALVEDNDR